MEKILIEKTPNPEALKFVLNQKISDKVYEFTNESSASPFAQKIMGFPWVKSLMIGENFITILKESWVEWEPLKEPLIHLIQEHLDSKEPFAPLSSSASSEKLNTESLSATAKKIKQIIEQDIQPAVQMDGGFIQFENYKDGVVWLKLKGACSGCPSAEITLKQGIESHLKNKIPEIKSVSSI